MLNKIKVHKELRGGWFIVKKGRYYAPVHWSETNHQVTAPCYTIHSRKDITAKGAWCRQFWCDESIDFVATWVTLATLKHMPIGHFY